MRLGWVLPYPHGVGMGGRSVSGSWNRACTPHRHRPVVWYSWIEIVADTRMGMGTDRMGMGNHWASPAVGAGNAGLVIRIVRLLTWHIHITTDVITTQDIPWVSHAPFRGVERSRVSEVLLATTVGGRPSDAVGVRYANIPTEGQSQDMCMSK